MDTRNIVRLQDEAKYGGKFHPQGLIVAYYNAYSAGNIGANARD